MLGIIRGSADGLRHLKDVISVEYSCQVLLPALSAYVDLVLDGRTPLSIRLSFSVLTLQFYRAVISLGPVHCQHNINTPFQRFISYLRSASRYSTYCGVILSG